MKHYQGRRTIDGIMVTVDGEPLDTRYDLEQFTDLGFEWSYEGDSPRQLALALIAESILSRKFVAKRKHLRATGTRKLNGHQWTLEG